MVGIVIITTIGVIFIQGNMSSVNEENTINAQGSIEEEIGTGAENTAIEILSSLDGIMNDQIMMVKSWARAPIVVNTAKDAMSYTMEELYDRWSNTTTREYDGGEAVGDGDPENDINPEASHYLITLSQDSNGAYPEVFFTDARGYAIAANGATGDFDQGPDDWRAFQDTTGGSDTFVKHDPSADGEGWWAAANSASDGIYVGAVEYDYSAGIWGTDICVVIYDGTSNVGVLKAVYNFALALSSVIDVSDLEADEIKVIDGQGLIAASSETDQTKVMNPDVTVSDLAAFESASQGNNGYTVEVDEDGEEMVIGYASCDEDDWICLVSHRTSTSLVPIKEIESKNSQLVSDVNSQVIFIIITEVAVAVIILIAVATLLNRKLTKPLVDIADTAKEVKEGNLNVKVDESGNNEISELARAFNQMVLSVRLVAGAAEMEGPGMDTSGGQECLLK
jgi:HAMP domain-containing protein